MDDDIHFRNEERKKNSVGWSDGWEEKQQRQRGRGRKKKCFAWLQSKRGGRHVFPLTLGSSGDRRLCMRLRVRVEHVHIVVGLIRPLFLGMGEKALVARKKQPLY